MAPSLPSGKRVAMYPMANWGGTVSILLDDGDGSFGAAADFAAGVALTFVAVGDFNGDGYLDLALAGAYDDTVSILINGCHVAATAICRTQARR